MSSPAQLLLAVKIGEYLRILGTAEISVEAGAVIDLRGAVVHLPDGLIPAAPVVFQAGKAGLVPAPVAADVAAGKVLVADATWKVLIPAFDGIPDGYVLTTVGGALAWAPGGSGSGGGGSGGGSSGSSTVLTYASDGDTNGVFYYFGTSMGTASWVNPQSNGSLVVTVPTGLAQGDVSGVTDRQPSDLLTGNSGGSSYIFDLGAVYALNPSAYSYRNRSSDGSSCPQAWKFQGSADGSTWTDLDTQSGLSWSGGSIWKTCQVPAQANSYRYLRLLQVDPNNTNGGNNFFAMGEFELYGTLKKKATVQKVLTYQSDGDANGAFYFAGQGFNAGNSWSNPAGSNITLTSNAGVQQNSLPTITDRTTNYVGLYPAGSGSYVVAAFPAGVSLAPTAFLFRFRADDNSYTTAGLQLEGSADGQNWTDLGTHNGLTPVVSGWVHFAVTPSAAFRFFRLTQTQSANNSGYFYIGEWELYGTLTYPQG